MTLAWRRWQPLAVALVVMAAVLLASHTAPLDILRYIGYAVLSVIGPGMLVFRSLRRRPHTFVEDVAFGAAVGLVLELAGWAVFGALGLQGVVWLWPLLVYVPFAAVPRLRRHWLVRDYPSRPSLVWSWTVAGAISFFSLYLYVVFFSLNPIVPDTESTDQFLDLAYQLSLAGEAKHHMPLDLPQVAGEPLHYHWFAFSHLAMGSLVGGIDLPVLTMRLMVLAICALTTLLLAVVAWRITGRPFAGAAAALLFAVVGEFDFVASGWPPFGTQVAFVIWPSLSMTYSWVLLVALIGALADRLPRWDGDSTIDPIGPGAWGLVGLFALASSAAKASSLPVALSGLALAWVAVLVFRRRFPWAVTWLGIIVAGAQLFALAAIFAFERYGLSITALQPIKQFLPADDIARSPLKLAVLHTAVWLAFLLHLQLRAAGIVPLMWLRRGRLTPVQWFLLGGAIAGPALNLLLKDYAATWFTRAGFPFSIILSVWGFMLVFERARVSRRGTVALAIGSGAYALLLMVVAAVWALPRYPTYRVFAPVLPMLIFGAVLAVIATLVAAAWVPLRSRAEWMRGRGGLVLLIGILLAGSGGLVLDARFSWGVPGGPYTEKALVPASQVVAARWVRDHSDPEDVIATNSHCVNAAHDCAAARSFWLSAYSERSVLIEGWAFAPRVQTNVTAPFWDQDLFQLNEDAFYAPTEQGLRQLHDERHVRFLVAVRRTERESPALAGLADLVYDNGGVAVYELR